MLRECLICVICNFLIFPFLYNQTLHNECSHIEDVYLLFCAHLIIFYYVFGRVELRHFSVQSAYTRCWVNSLATWLEWSTVTQEFWVRIMADPDIFPLELLHWLHCV